MQRNRQIKHTYTNRPKSDTITENAKRCGCWAYLRRYFLNALDAQEDKTNYSTIAGQGLLMIQEIFALEKTDPKNPREKRKYTLEETAEIREKNSAKKTKGELCPKV